ncbi:MAG TPA: hypothetical protein VGN19_05785 [Pedococcus sp.]|nr:hypothetical protein [Pedococcus sp.]
MSVAEPKCNHATPLGSVIVSSHKDIRKAKGRMASVRVCHRDACIEDAARWVSIIGPGPVWVEGVKR